MEILIIVLIIASLMLNVFTIYKLNSKKSMEVDLSKLDILQENIKNLFENQRVMISQLEDSQLKLIQTYNGSVIESIDHLTNLQKKDLEILQTKLNELIRSNEERMEKLITGVQTLLNKMLEQNEKKLEDMRLTVDEKLNQSLERRLNESFALISERLESVQNGLGEMKNLASGVGDLKKVLTNVKTRGTFGEVQLGALIEQMLAPSQYAEQVQINDNLDRVDFAIFMPGKNNDTVLLPVDSKFPIEDYNRLVDAEEKGDLTLVETSRKALERRVKEEAKKIHDKYISVPKTTEFGVMYLATEGLYSEVLKNVGLIETIQRDYRIILCGPTTFSALLNSLQMGFKTLAIEKQSADIWNALSVFKKEFVTFVDLLTKTQKKIDEAGSSLESATKKSHTIQKKLDKFVGIEFEEKEQKLIDIDSE